MVEALKMCRKKYSIAAGDGTVNIPATTLRKNDYISIKGDLEG